MIDQLRTPRLLLRRWTPADRAPFAALNADPPVVEHLPGPLTRAESDALVERIEAGFAQRGFGHWAVELPGEGFVGFTGLAVPAFEAEFLPGVEVGWRAGRGAGGTPPRRRPPSWTPRSGRWRCRRCCRSPPSPTCGRRR